MFPDSTHHFPAGSRENPHEVVWSLHVHRTFTAVEALEFGWRKLTPDNASPFQTYSWNLAWYRNFASGDGAPLIFEIKKAGVTAAILPCYFAGKTIRLAGDRLCGRQDVIALEKDAVRAIIGLSMDWLKREAKRSYFHFETLSSDGLLYQALHEPDELPGGALMFESTSAPWLFLDLKGGLDQYLASLPRRIRLKLGRSLRHFNKDAPVARVVKLRDYQIRVDDLANAAAFHIEHCRTEGVSPFLDARLIGLFGEITKDPDVGFQLSCLTNQGDFLAVDFGFIRAGRYYGFLSAFDRAFEKLDPRKCHFLKRFDSWVKVDGVHAVVSPSGDEKDGSEFPGALADPVWTVCLMPQGLRNRARHIGLKSNKEFRRLAKSALEKSSILPR